MHQVALIEQNCRIREALPIDQELVSNYHQKRVPAHWRYIAAQPDTEVVVESEDLQAVGFVGSLVSGLLESAEFRRLFVAKLRNLHRLAVVVDKVEATRKLPAEPIALSALVDRGGKLVPPPDWTPPADFQWFRPAPGAPASEPKSAAAYKAEGLQAYEDGTPRTDCPYPRAHVGHAGWIAGWRAAAVLDDSEPPPRRAAAPAEPAAEPEDKPNGTPRRAPAKKPRKRDRSRAAKARRAREALKVVQEAEGAEPQPPADAPPARFEPVEPAADGGKEPA